MEKANVIDMRKVLVLAEEYRKAGVLFMPMPVLNKEDKDTLCKEAVRRLSVLAQSAELD
jgi:hypothetical protein